MNFFLQTFSLKSTEGGHNFLNLFCFKAFGEWSRNYTLLYFHILEELIT